MLAKTNDDNLNISGMDPKLYLFYQVWKELTDRRTIDSYQYRIMNTLSILDELNAVIGLKLSGATTTNHNVDDCRCEAASIIKSDSVLKKYNNPLWRSLLSHLCRKAEDPTQLKALHYQITYSYGMIAPWYVKKLFEELEGDIDRGDQPGIVTKTSSLISCCATSGWSTPALFHLVDILHGSADEPQRWQCFKDRLLASSMHSYHVYIPLSVTSHSSKSDRGHLFKTLYSELSDFKIEVISREKAIEDDPLLGTDKTPVPEKKKLMRLHCEAFDRYSACYKAIDLCSSALSYFSFYSYIEPWDMDNVACWVTNSASSYIERFGASDLFQKYDSLQTDNKIFKASKRIFEQFDTPIAKKLGATYAYSNMGKAASSQEEKFMNSWVALESLCRSDVYNNIISNVLETVPPVLCSRYIYRLCRNFIEDCMRCNVTLAFRDKSYSFHPKTSWEERVRNIIQVFLDDEHYDELEGKCNVNSLLLYRCHEMKKLLSDHTAIVNRLKSHCLTVRQQLSRLYRIRNGIAHTGSTSINSLTIYTEHLNGYLASFVSEVVLAADSMGELSAEVVFEALKDNFSTFLDIAQQKDKTAAGSILQDVFLSGQIKLIRQHQEA